MTTEPVRVQKKVMLYLKPVEVRGIKQRIKELKEKLEDKLVEVFTKNFSFKEKKFYIEQLEGTLRIKENLIYYRKRRPRNEK